MTEHEPSRDVYPFRRNSLFYRVGWYIAWVVFKLGCFFSVEGKEVFPRSGPVILAGTHRSYMDVPLMGLSVHRQVHFMGKAELWGNWFKRWFCNVCGAFPVKRGFNDRQAVRTAIRCLDEGRVLGIFPEGARKDGLAVENLMPGVALIAQKSGAPIIPVALWGTDRLLGGDGKPHPFRKVRIVFGAPIDPAGYPESSTGRRQIMARLEDDLQNLYLRAAGVADDRSGESRHSAGDPASVRLRK